MGEAITSSPSNLIAITDDKVMLEIDITGIETIGKNASSRRLFRCVYLDAGG